MEPTSPFRFRMIGWKGDGFFARIEMKMHKTILPATNCFVTVLNLATLQSQKLALRAQTVCVAVASLR